MRILILTDEIYPDAIGGVGRTVDNECRGLAARGHQVSVVVRCRIHSLPPEERIDGIQIYRLYGPKLTSPLYYLYPLIILLKASRWLRQTPINADILYIFNPIYILSARLAGIQAPIAYSFFASMSNEISISVSHGKYGALNLLARIFLWILEPFERWAMGSVNMALPRSYFSEKLLRGLCPTARIPNPLIPLGVNTELYSPRSREAAREHLRLPLNRVILLCVRRLEHRMGLHNLITAMSTLRSKCPEVLLLIGGQGSLQEALAYQIADMNLQDHIHLLGFIAETDLPFYFNAADLFVLPTEFLEGFGLATLEALSSACPVIGTPIGATPELLAPIEPLALAFDSSADALDERVGYWLDRRDSLPEFGSKCRRAVEDGYSINEVATELENYFQELIERSTEAK